MKNIKVIVKEKDDNPLNNIDLIKNTYAYTGFHLENTAELLGVSSFNLQAAMIKFDIYFLEF